jgi:hypothetical protein
MHEGCEKIGNFGSAQERFCFQHNVENKPNYRVRKCEQCNERKYNTKYEGCFQCYSKSHPELIIKTSRVKEILVYDYLVSFFLDENITNDKRIPLGTSAHRPDIYFPLQNNRCIVVEVDEYCHSDYNRVKENERINALYVDSKKSQFILLRFNPDEYNSITSCFRSDVSGHCVVKTSKEDEWKERLDTLASRIEYWMDEDNNPTEPGITIERLFYNDSDT